MLNLLRVLLLGLLVGLPAPSWSGSMTLLGVGTGAAAILPTITFIGNTLATVSAPTATANGVSFGSAGSKLVVVAVHDAFGALTATMTIDGVSAVKVGEIAFGQSYTALFSAVTANASGNVVGTVTGGSWNGPNFSVYSITNLSSSTAVGSNTNSGTATNLSTTIATSAGGVALGIAASVASDVTPAVFSGTATYTTDVSSYNAGVGYVRSAGHASNTGASGSSTVTVTNSGSDNIALVAAAWR